MRAAATAGREPSPLLLLDLSSFTRVSCTSHDKAERLKAVHPATRPMPPSRLLTSLRAPPRPAAARKGCMHTHSDVYTHRGVHHIKRVLVVRVGGHARQWGTRTLHTPYKTVVVQLQQRRRYYETITTASRQDVWPSPLLCIRAMIHVLAGAYGDVCV